MERIPPHSEEAERSAIGAAMLSKDALLDVAEEVRPEDFYNESNKEIFDAILKLYRNNTAVDLLTVKQEKDPGYGRRQSLSCHADSRCAVNSQRWRICQDRG